MGVIITGVEDGSVAAHKGILPGDVLLSVNGHEIVDVLDYRFYMTESKLKLLISRDGTTKTVRLCKQPYEDAGLEFETYLMDKQHACRNQCIFCFIDQLPEGMRESLYFKDDDSRLSFLFGNYITLTNLTEHEIQRIISMHISPINISVHTTNPTLRCKMMSNRFAGDRLSVLRRFADAGIKMECQLVLCPGINDGEELIRTMEDLARLAPAVESVAGVPVGLTKHRQGLPALRSFTKDEAAVVIGQMEDMGERMLREHGIRVFFPADEFYLKADMPLPEESFYGAFSQLENGVGLMALLKTQFLEELENCEDIPRGRPITIATGTAAEPFIRGLTEAAREKWGNLNIEVVSIRNNFFGESIDVAGLVTGGDLIEQLKQRKLGETLLIPSVMLRREGDLFLDDVSARDVERALGVRVQSVPNDGEALVKALIQR
ncbi:MAG TPA: radical SAM protein [Ruminococcaceae bacterium]|nr:radical SAM protein [Oscillospiraceae bacterium]HCA30588.1 radical SAM protein [Oscillospiraceae bacterium]